MTKITKGLKVLHTDKGKQREGIVQTYNPFNGEIEVKFGREKEIVHISKCKVITE